MAASSGTPFRIRRARSEELARLRQAENRNRFVDLACRVDLLGWIQPRLGDKLLLRSKHARE